MLVHLILSVAVVLCASAGMAEAKQCAPAIRHAVHHRSRCHCAPLRHASLRHRRHVHRPAAEPARAELRQDRDDGRAYRYAEADERRWRDRRDDAWGLRPSPPHPWDTNPSGYLTWPGKNQAYAVQDRYSENPPPQP